MNDDVRFERVIAAAPERVFAAFTSPREQREFYGKDRAGWIVESGLTAAVYAASEGLRTLVTEWDAAAARRATGRRRPPRRRRRAGRSAAGPAPLTTTS